MKMSLYIVKEHNKQAKQNIEEALYQFNLKHFPVDLRGRYEEIHLFIKDENDNVRGELLAEVCWNWLEINILIIDEGIRASGFGTKLLLEIEEIALERESDFIKVDTLSFQALGFYEKNGYKVFGSLDNVGRDHKHYYLKKDLIS